MSTDFPNLPRVDAYLHHYAVMRPDTPAWLDEGHSLTFAQADAWVDDLARSMLASGVQSGDRVAVYGKPGIEFIGLFVAITSIGAVYLGLNPKYTAGELATVIEDATPSLLFNLSDDSALDGEKLTLACRHVTLRRRIDGLSELTQFATVGSAVSRPDLDLARQAVRPGSVALMVYTSGTTGTPKGAQLTHRGMTFVAPITADPVHFGTEGQGRTLCNLPINHVGCVVDICSNNIIMGNTLVFQADFDPDRALEVIETQRLTSVGGIPVMFLMMSRSARFASTDYSSLEKIILAGNAAPISLVRELRRVMGVPIMNGYGLTEAMGFSTFTDIDADDDTVANTVGCFDPRVEWRLADEQSNTVAPGQVGEIQMRGDWLFAGYFRRPEASAKAFTADGWFHTGDLANLLPSGMVKLTGRLTEMFKSGGYNVYPAEIEKAIEAQLGIAMAVVVQVPDDTYAEVGYAYIVQEPGHAPLDVSAFRDQLRQCLANYKIPKHFRVMDELPMLPIGKIDRLALKRMAASSVSALSGATAPQPG